MTNKDITKITMNLVIIYVIGGLLLAGVYSITSPIIFVKSKEEKEAALQKMMPVTIKVTPQAEKLEAVAEVLKAAGVVPEQTVAERAEGGEGAPGGATTLTAEVDLTKPELKKLLKQLKRAGAGPVDVSSQYLPVKAGDWEPWHKHAEYYIVNGPDGTTAGYIAETFGKGYSSYINVLVATDKDFVVRKINVLHHAETPGLGDEIETAWFLKMFKGKDVEHLVVIKGETKDKIQAITGATISTRAVTDGVRDALEMLAEKSAGGAIETGGTVETGGDEKGPGAH